MSLASLEAEFDEAMMNIYRRALAEADYNAGYFLAMLMDRGGLATARALINSPSVSTGYTALWERRRLDLTVEALVSDNEKWQPLFTSEELAACTRRLTDYGYYS